MTRETFDRIARVRKRAAMWGEVGYLEDLPDKPSLRKAFRLVRSAVKLGLREAQGSLAHAYDRVDSVRPSRRMAVHWYRKAWRSGSSTAARNLGNTMQLEGRTTTAMLWFRRAIAGGDPDACFDLAKLLLKKPNHLQEAMRLLEEHIAAGPQTYYSYGKDEPSVKLEDEEYEAAKQLLQELKGSASA